jgi:superfamily II DNA/RNA helicase
VHRCGRAGRQVKDTNSSTSVTSKQSEVKSSSTVYSFFNRELEAMAKDVVSLLESCNAWVDPNLQELIDSPGGGGGNNNSKKRKENKKPSRKEEDPDVKKNKATNLNEDDEWDDGQFSNLAGNRIVLKRATHVSDASSDSEEDEDE